MMGRSKGNTGTVNSKEKKRGDSQNKAEFKGGNKDTKWGIIQAKILHEE